MNTVNRLVEAEQALADHFGPRFAATDTGGEQQLTTFLGTHFDLPADATAHLFRALEQAGIITWQFQPGADHPCLPIKFGTWSFHSL